MYSKVLYDRIQNRALFPFYVSVVLYFAIFQPCIVIPPPSITAAIFKALPVWTLAFYVRLTSNDRSDRLIPRNLLRQNIIFALLFSSLGDIFLIFDTDLFEDGFICFAIAQLFYFSVIRGTWSESRMRYIFIFFGLVSFSFVMNVIDDAIMDAFIFFYMVLLYTLGWRATSRLIKEEVTFEGLCACTGSILFILSQSMLAINKLSTLEPLIDFIGMILYYVAHFCYVLTTGPVQISLRIENVMAILLKTRRF